MKKVYSYNVILIICLASLFMPGCGDGIHIADQNLEQPSPLLQNIELSAGALSSRFDPFKTEYQADVSEDIVSIALKVSVHKGIHAAINNGEASIDINGIAYSPGVFSAPVGLDVWNPDTNVIVVSVASFGNTRDYIISINLVPVADKTFQDVAGMVDDGSGDQQDVTFDGKYRDDLSNHPGCIKRTSYDANILWSVSFSYIPNEISVPVGFEATILGYPCAAKEYVVVEDSSKPIVVLVHGSTDSINVWEEFYTPLMSGWEVITKSFYPIVVDTIPREMLASKLVRHGFRTIAIDFRTDLVAALSGYNQASYAGKNYLNPNYGFDHGWTVPILQQLLKSLMIHNPGRKISIVAHSLGATTTRDALRRLFVEYIGSVSGAVNPWPHLKDLVFLHGANHGTNMNMELCELYASMYMQMYCQFGDMKESVQTEFMKRLNGPNDKWSTPCGDGASAFGLAGYCQGNAINYMTIAIDDDLSNTKIRDEMFSEASIRINSPYCENVVLSPDSCDSSGYFFAGQYANHFAGPRSDKGMEYILQKLLD